MKILLDTNALIWWMEDDSQLGPRARATMADPANRILATIVSIWEVTMKWRSGKFPWPGSTFLDFLDVEQIDLIQLRRAHLEQLERMDVHHKDPFDHIVVAQALVEGAVILTSDRALTQYGARCLPASL